MHKHNNWQIHFLSSLLKQHQQTTEPSNYLHTLELIPTLTNWLNITNIHIMHKKSALSILTGIVFISNFIHKLYIKLYNLIPTEIPFKYCHKCLIPMYYNIRKTFKLYLPIMISSMLT